MEQELKHEVATIDEAVKAVVIRDQESYEGAGQMIIAIDKLLKRIKEYWDEPIRKAHEAHKILTLKRSEMYNPVEAKRKELDRKVRDYLTEQERIRREEQRKIDEARRKAEEAERAKLAKQAERAEAAGKTEKAEALREKVEEVYIPPSVVETVERTTRTDAGTVTAKTDIEIEITDHKKILKHIIDGTLPITIVSISEPKLKATLKLHQITQLDGVHIREVSKAQYRGR